MAVRRFTARFLALSILAGAAGFTAKAAEPAGQRVPGPERSPSVELSGGWHFVRTRNPRGGADAVSIMHTADTSKSDLDLAGLTIRCREGGTEIVLVFIRSFPLRAQPSVVFGQPGHEARFKATVAAPGTALLIPGDANTLIGGSWQALSNLWIRVEDGQNTISGVVPLDGLKAGFQMLGANCPAP